MTVSIKVLNKLQQFAVNLLIVNFFSLFTKNSLLVALLHIILSVVIWDSTAL